MSDPESTRYDEDEIDLFEVLNTLWAEKIVISATTVLALLAGLLPLLTSPPPPLFEVKTPYAVRVAPMDTYRWEVCRDDTCRLDIIAQRAVLLSKGEWRSVDDNSALALTTTSPLPVADYQYNLGELNQVLRTNIQNEAEAEVYVIENEIHGNLRQSEVIASSLLQAKLVIFLLEREGMPLAFGGTSISEVKNNSRRFTLFPAFFGALAGIVFVLLRKSFRDHRIAKGEIRS